MTTMVGRVMLEIKCTVCGARGVVQPMPNAKPIALDDRGQTPIVEQALDLYGFASRALRDCEKCEGVFDALICGACGGRWVADHSATGQCKS